MKQFSTLIIVGLIALVGCADDEQISPTAVDAGFEGAGSIENVEMLGESGHVTGSAHLQVFAANGLGLRKLTFNAIRRADGSVSGEWNLVAGSSIMHGDIDCLNILPGGTVARLSGVVTSAKFTSFQPGTAFALEVHDSGPGRDETSNIRAFRNLTPEVGRLFCETGEAPTDLQMDASLHGNLTIHVDK